MNRSNSHDGPSGSLNGSPSNSSQSNTPQSIIPQANIPQSNIPQSNIPLCVDLDGTLIKTDLFFESLVLFLWKSPWRVLEVLFALLKGRAVCKSFIAQQVMPRFDLLPYHEEVVEYIQSERERGRRTVLVTATHERFAEGVANHLGFFDDVHATTSDKNLKGGKKAEFLKQRYGEFEYIGDSSADLAVWKSACHAGIVQSHPSVVRRALTLHPEATRFSSVRASSGPLRMLRIHQWVKNFLVFLPLLMAHRVGEFHLLVQAAIAFLLFSMTASAVYIFNDLGDVENDRTHHSKKHRPLAAGDVSIPFAVGSGLTLFVVAFLLSGLLPWRFSLVLAGYFLLTSAYSLRLKKIAVLDVVTLASLYTIRILAGGAATEVAISEWLLTFSLFIFFSLACMKRLSELLGLAKRNLTETVGRGYHADDVEQMAIFGSVSGYLSILVLALYINSPIVSELYAAPSFLWLLCPVLLFWITRIWLLARRGEVHEDPIVFALRDRASYVVFGLAIGIMLFASAPL